MSVTELETRIVKMQEWEQLAQDAAAEAEAIRDTIKAEMLARDTDELTVSPERNASIESAISCFPYISILSELSLPITFRLDVPYLIVM